MTAEELRLAYSSFFVKSAAGQNFVNEVIRLIVNEHEKAESTPVQARDHTQRAKGVRLVKDHIDSVTAGGKKPISR